MYAHIQQRKRIRARVVTRGESLRSVAQAEGISRNTARKMVRYELPPGYRRTANFSQPPVCTRGVLGHGRRY
ncbi:lambda repressor-like predicted transcriptional regulator [Paraburkholderia sp. WC7.3d]